MSNSHVWLACSSASLLISLAGCGGTAPTTASTTPARTYTPCENPAQVRLAPTVCFDPVGSTWRVVADAPGGHYDFRIALLAGGRVRSTDHPAAGPGTDEWFVEDDTLRIFLGNRYVEYRGRLQNGSVFIGEASNVRGDTWEFRADRVHEGGQCQVNELVTHAGDEPGCYSAAGSSWTIQAGSRSFDIALSANGAIASSDATDTTPANDRWQQEGGTLRLSFDDGASTFTAVLDPAHLDRLEGQMSGRASGAFTATATPSYAPPAR
jgi:hypothetical protein